MVHKKDMCVRENDPWPGLAKFFVIFYCIMVGLICSTDEKKVHRTLFVFNVCDNNRCESPPVSLSEGKNKEEG